MILLNLQEKMMLPNQNNNITLESISYTLVQSKRARSVQLKICRKRGLQIIMPRRFNQNEIPELLQKHKRWIEKTWNRVKPGMVSEEIPPEPIDELHARAKKYLVNLLDEISKETELFYNRVSIRNVSTRWGSCSAKKHISLNLKLMFLPAELIRYVVIHELCHTVYFNHSKKFWQLVQKFDPNCHVHRKQLKESSQYVPLWLEK